MLELIIDNVLKKLFFVCCLFVVSFNLTAINAFAETSAEASAVASKNSAAIPVTVKSFKQLAIYPVVQVSATVVSLNDSKLSAEVNAIIEDIVVDVGQTVSRGSILLKLDSSYYQLEFERSKAALLSIKAKYELAKYQLVRAKNLSSKKIVSEEVLAKKEADVLGLSGQVKVQKALRDIAKRNLDRCIVKAPFKAIIKARLGHVGELASIGTPLVHVVDAEKLEISAKIQTSDIVTLKSAKKIELVSQGGRFTIRLKNITPAYDSLERSQEVRFTFLDVIDESSGDSSGGSSDEESSNITNKKDLPGAFGKIIWSKTMPHIPAELMVRRDGNLGVFVLQDNVSKFVSLLNAKEGQPVAQTQLSEDVSIIIDGRYRLQDGSRVNLKQ